MNYCKMKNFDSKLKDSTLQQVRLYLSSVIDKTAFPDQDDINFTVFFDKVKERLYANFRLLFWGQRTKTFRMQDICYPASLWDHFKKSLKRKLPNFLGKRIKYYNKTSHVVTNIYHVCPHIGVSGKKGDHLEFLRGEQP